MPTLEEDFADFANDGAPAGHDDSKPDEGDDQPRGREDDFVPDPTDETGEANDETDETDETAPEGGEADPAPAEKAPSLADLIALAPKDKADIYKSLIEAALADQHRVRSDDGRVAAMQRLYGEQKRQAEALTGVVADLEAKVKSGASDKSVAAAAAAAQEEADSLAKEFPELSDQINVRVEALLNKRLANASPASTPASAKRDDQQAPAPDAMPEVDALQTEYAALQAAHKDWQEIAKSDIYASWKQAQGPEVQRLMSSDLADDAIRVLDRFKMDLAAIRQRSDAAKKVESTKRLANNVGIKGSAQRPTSVPDDYESAFAYYARNA